MKYDEDIGKRKADICGLLGEAMDIAHTQSNLAKHLGVSRKAVSGWLSGAEMSIRNLTRLETWLKSVRRKYPKRYRSHKNEVRQHDEA